MLKRTAASLITIGAIAGTLVTGCGKIDEEAKSVQHDSPKTARQDFVYVDKLSQFIDNYKAGDIDAKSKLVRKLYNGKAALVPVSYNSSWNEKRTYGNVVVEGIEGVVVVMYFDKPAPKPVTESDWNSERGHAEALSGFELDGRAMILRLNSLRRVVPSYLRVGGVELDLPEGYSLVTAREKTNPSQEREMAWALRLAQKQNSELGLTRDERNSIIRALRSLNP